MDSSSSLPIPNLTELVKNSWTYEVSLLVEFPQFGTTTQCISDFIYEMEMNSIKENYSYLFDMFFSVCFYSNGDSAENEGYVSVFLNFFQAFAEWKITQFSLYAVVFVIDAIGDLRYPQTFAEEHNLEKEWEKWEDAHYRFGLEQYLKRETILNSSDLLHGDTLKMRCDVTFSINPSPKKANWYQKQFDQYEKKEGWFIQEDISAAASAFLNKFHFAKKTRHSLNFENQSSPICQLLKRKSSYFERLFKTSLEESKQKLLPVKSEEYQAFFYMLCYIRFENLNHVYRIEDYFDLYVIADKYEVTDLKSRCSEYMRHHIAINTAAEILILSDMCSDASLKEFVIQYILANKFDVIQTEGWKLLAKEWKRLAREIIHFAGDEEEFFPAEKGQIDWFGSKNYFRINRHFVSSDFSAYKPNSFYTNDEKRAVQSCPTKQREVVRPRNLYKTINQRENVTTDGIAQAKENTQWVQEKAEVLAEIFRSTENEVDALTYDFYQ